MENDTQFAGNYTIHCLLGEGGQANVYLGSKDNKLYALKVYFLGQSNIRAFKTEVELYSKLNFFHLINMVDHCLEANIKLKNQPIINKPLLVLQFAESGDLFEFLSKLGKFKPEACRAYTKQLISAIKYLHDVKVTHRDLKPQNILFDKNFNLKVSDFGLSRDSLGDTKDYKLYSKVGTEGYRPPQMEIGNYTGLQADMFSVGVILFIMYNGTPPFLSTKAHDNVYKVIRQKNFAKFWKMHEKNKPLGFYTDSFKRLINSFFSFEEDKRPTFESLETDQWLNGDEMTKNELEEYMKTKYNIITEADNTKKHLYLKQIIKDEQCNDDSQERGNIESFVSNYQKFKVNCSLLHETNSNKLIFVKQNPSFILAWINDWISEQIKLKNNFIEGFVEEITPISFTMVYQTEENKINLKLIFEIENEYQEELQLEGRLCKNKEKFGVCWKNGQGNKFWLSRIQSHINKAISYL